MQARPGRRGRERPLKEELAPRISELDCSAREKPNTNTTDTSAPGDDRGTAFSTNGADVIEIEETSHDEAMSVFSDTRYPRTGYDTDPTDIDGLEIQWVVVDDHSDVSPLSSERSEDDSDTSTDTDAGDVCYYDPPPCEGAEWGVNDAEPQVKDEEDESPRVGAFGQGRHDGRPDTERPSRLEGLTGTTWEGSLERVQDGDADEEYFADEDEDNEDDSYIEEGEYRSAFRY